MIHLVWKLNQENNVIVVILIVSTQNIKQYLHLTGCFCNLILKYILFCCYCYI